MLVSFTDDLFDCISEYIMSNDLYKLLLVNKDLNKNIKKNPIELKRKELRHELLNFNPYNRLKKIILNLNKKYYIPHNPTYIFENYQSNFYDINYHKIIVMQDLYENLKININNLCNILILLNIHLKDKSLQIQNIILREISNYSIRNINKNLITILHEIYKIITKNLIYASASASASALFWSKATV